jgi:hypothetical protein
MKFYQYIKSALLVVALTTATSASANIIEFDYSTLNTTSASLDLTMDGQTVNVTGWVWNNGAYQQSTVIANSNGLGVVGGFDANRVGDNNNNNHEHGDYLLFSGLGFNALDIWFADSNNDVKLRVGESASLEVLFDGASQATTTVNGSAANFGINDVSANSFIIKNIGGGNGFKIDKVSIDVPEPSTLAIFALGIMGLAARRSNKRV